MANLLTQRRTYTFCKKCVCAPVCTRVLVCVRGGGPCVFAHEMKAIVIISRGNRGKSASREQIGSAL